MSTRPLATRLFLTCWLLYAVHFATDFVREHYLVVSIVDARTFDLTPYHGLHPDIFRNPAEAPRSGVHHGANPGISMIATIPYAMLKPIVDRVVARELRSRNPADTVAVFRDETRARRLAFYQATRSMGLDVRFGLVVMITSVLCMAPLAAASVVGVFRLFAALGATTAAALALSLVYAFATPVFLRASTLNQNLAVAIFSFAAFLLLWNPGGTFRWREGTRQALAGFLGGLCFLCDYSGALTLGALGLYLLATTWSGSLGTSVRPALRYALGAVGPILALWFYQWRSFGHPLYPPQHWMAPVEWIEVGYQGVGGPQWELFAALLLDPRYGLLPSAPIFLCALVAPFVLWRGNSLLPRRELVLCYAITAAYLVFFSSVQYTRLQWVTGIRYILPVVPFLFVPVALLLVRLPRILAVALVLVSFVTSWSMTMMRSQTGVFDAVMRFILEGVRLPALTTFSRMSAQYAPWLDGYASPYPALALVAAALAAIWLLPDPFRSLSRSPFWARQTAGTGHAAGD